MAITLNQNTDCCETSCTSTTVNTPGPQGPAGPAGANGTNGADGISAYTNTTATYTVPAALGIINAYVTDDTDVTFTAGQIVYFANIGHFKVLGVGSDYLNVQRLDYTGDPGVTGGTIPSGTLVVPAGLQGPAGADGEITGLTAKGQLATFGTAADKLNVGANGTALYADSTQALGIKWKQPAFSDLSGTVDLSGSQVSGQIDISGSSVTGSLPLADLANSGGAAGDLAYWNGSNWVRLGIGSAGQVLSLSGSTPQWTDSGTDIYAAKVKAVSTGTGASNTTTSWGVNIATAALNGTGPKMDITFTDPVSVDLPVFAFEEVSGSLQVTTVSGRTTAGLSLEVISGSSTSRTFVFYILND
ncbi:MAG: hypothetical protein VW907_00465 [Opitutae bacterium]